MTNKPKVDLEKATAYNTTEGFIYNNTYNFIS